MEQTTQNNRSLEKELFIKVAPLRVFQALTEKGDMERWFVQKAEIDVRLGGAIRLEWAPGMFEVGKIVALEPLHRFSYTWEAFSPSPTTVNFELTAENDGTRLHFTQSGIGEGKNWGNYYEGMGHGWNIHLKNLISWLETGICNLPGPTNSL
jgi:uncharacterized protein YndB with AHSA1/START domain